MKQRLNYVKTLAAGPGAKVPPKSIVSLVDFSAGSIRGAKLAATLARRRRYYRLLESRLKTLAGCRRLSGAAVLDGDPKEVLRGLAAERSEDLIVMGGASDAFDDRLFGSVGRAVVDAVRVPVGDYRQGALEALQQRLPRLQSREASSVDKCAFLKPAPKENRTPVSALKGPRPSR